MRILVSVSVMIIWNQSHTKKKFVDDSYCCCRCIFWFLPRTRKCSKFWIFNCSFNLSYGRKTVLSGKACERRHITGLNSLFIHFLYDLTHMPNALLKRVFLSGFHHVSVFGFEDNFSVRWQKTDKKAYFYVMKSG